MTNTPRSGRPNVIELAPGSRIEVLASGRETGRTVTVLRWMMARSSRGPDAHFHRSFAETFIVEQGAVDILAGDTWHHVGPGGCVHAPAGAVHAVKKHNDEPASLLMVLTPGVPREDYFAELVGCAEGDLDALHAKHDNHFVA